MRKEIYSTEHILRLLLTVVDIGGSKGGQSGHGPRHGFREGPGLAPFPRYIKGSYF